MEPVALALFAFVPVAWTAAAATYAGALLRAREASLARPLALGAALLHVLALLAVAACGVPPVASAGGLVGAVGLSVCVVYLWVEGRIGNRATGVFPMTLAAVLSAAGNGLGDPLAPVDPALLSWGFAGHILAAILGYAGLLLGAVFGSLFLLQRRAMRRRDFGPLWERLPSLELLDQFYRSSLLAGFVFLTLTIGLGHVIRYEIGFADLYSDPKVWATNAMWLLTGLTVIARWRGLLTAKVGALASIVLLGLAFLNLVAVDLWSTLH